MLLINKSDFLSEKQRLAWLRHYEAKNIHVVFWSAALATDIDPDAMSETSTEDDEEACEPDSNESGEESEEDSGDDETESASSKMFNKFDLLGVDEVKEEDEDSDKSPELVKKRVDVTVAKELEESDEGSETEVEAEEEAEEEAEVEAEEEAEVQKCEDVSNNKVGLEESVSEEKFEHHDDYEISAEERDKCRILSRSELIALFKSVHKSPDKAKPGITTIGLVGYPNVGKSSTINAILQDKKVAVSETPGKTKHYQTLFFDDELLLCDCPGLVFPSFVSTRGELILNGILPIDQMKDYVEPCNLLTSHVPRSVFEMYYGISITRPKEYEDPDRLPTSEELCSAYASKYLFRSMLVDWS